jgi:2-methylaconitate cis-trans-isomerase PrpF
VTDPATAGLETPAVPKVAIVGPPAAYRTLGRAGVDASEVDLVSRVISMGRAHRAYALTAAMCLAIAARIPGTVAHEAAVHLAAGGDVRIGHPSGVLAVAAAVAGDATGGPSVRSVSVYRTARRLMEGFVLVAA